MKTEKWLAEATREELIEEIQRVENNCATMARLYYDDHKWIAALEMADTSAEVLELWRELLEFKKKKRAEFDKIAADVFEDNGSEQ